MVVIEGILALHGIQTLDLSNKLTVFIESDSYLSYLKRRSERDVKERDTSVEETRKRELTGVRQAFFSHILPTRQSADITIANNDDKSTLGGDETPVSSNIDKGVQEISALVMSKCNFQY